MNNVLFMNLAHDAAGVSIAQCDAMNKYTDWKARHFRAVKTFNYRTDITPENYNRDEFAAIVEKSDVIEFCSADHTYKMSIGPMNAGHNTDARLRYEKFNKMTFGFDFWEKAKRKVKIFHDYNSYFGAWEDRARAKDIWTRKDDIKYEGIFSSIPQAVNIYKDCVYIPDIVDERLAEYTPNGNRDFGKVVCAHYPTGGIDTNNKNTKEFLEAVAIEPVDIDFIQATVMNDEILRRKRSVNLAFDALWRGFHGMTTVENMALGIPTMCRIDEFFWPVFGEFFQTDKRPIDNVNDVAGIAACIKKYKDDPALLAERAKEVREFSMKYWSARYVTGKMVKEYEKLLEKK